MLSIGKHQSETEYSESPREGTPNPRHDVRTRQYEIPRLRRKGAIDDKYKKRQQPAVLSDVNEAIHVANFLIAGVIAHD